PELLLEQELERRAEAAEIGIGQVRARTRTAHRYAEVVAVVEKAGDRSGAAVGQLGVEAECDLIGVRRLEVRVAVGGSDIARCRRLVIAADRLAQRELLGQSLRDV